MDIKARICIIIISFQFILSSFIVCLPRSALDDGTTCAVCTVLATLLFEHPDNFDYLSSTSSPWGVQNLCNSIGNSNEYLEYVCLQEAQKQIHLNPDKFCEKIGVCDPSCKLFVKTTFPPSPLPPSPPNDPPNRNLYSNGVEELLTQWQWLNRLSYYKASRPFYEFSNRITESLLMLDENTSGSEKNQLLLPMELLPTHPCYNNSHVLKCIIDRFTDEHYPIFEVDGDSFGPKEYRGFRGSNWRGADCNDSDINIYPGRRQNYYSNDETIDHDCNGIYGINTVTGKSWEETLCDGVPRRGLIHIGDSASAHFHIPPQWLTRNGWNLGNLIPDAVDELDQPSCAWGTGYRNVTSCPFSNGTRNRVGSIASRLRERNLCNHRDFQNVAVNGAGSDNAMKLVPSVKRDKNLDNPALVIFSLIGNDVCNSHEGTSHMTTPTQFHDNILGELKV